ncbi:DUF2290 domain-containing protein [Chloroflexota bacterium]|nr:DUF2290 domain-containing protein [Chloroflexota bacterium]
MEKTIMNRGLVETEINDAWTLLKRLGLGKDREYHPGTPSNPAALFRRLTYQDYWSTSFNEHYYNFLLFDNSIIDFRFNSFRPLNFTYSYIECPYIFVTFFDYVKNLDIEIDSQDYQELEWDLKKAYDMEGQDQELKLTVTPIRYDFAPEIYTLDVHPASHFHLGFKNEIRIGTKRILHPLSFILFVLRHCYPNKWIEFISIDQYIKFLPLIRDSLDEIDASIFFNEKEMILE